MCRISEFCPTESIRKLSLLCRVSQLKKSSHSTYPQLLELGTPLVPQPWGGAGGGGRGGGRAGRAGRGGAGRGGAGGGAGNHRELVKWGWQLAARWRPSTKLVQEGWPHQSLAKATAGNLPQTSAKGSSLQRQKVQENYG